MSWFSLKLSYILVIGLMTGCAYSREDWRIDGWYPEYKGCKVSVKIREDENRIKIKCKRKVSWLGT